MVISLLTILITPISPIHAAECVPVKPTGKTVGQISIGNITLPIKSFDYPSGGVMEPQASTLMAGLSSRHMPLSSTMGTSVIVWHRDYNGCVNSLNALMDKEVGSVFDVTDENGVVKRYKIEQILVVTKGSYKKSWFTLIGPRQLALFTCTGAFKNGHYEKNMVFIAKAK